ncbi:tRNA endonuclease ANKZF1 isoform X2 [Hemibagrus wyckioides]|uniref:tRNA endonuclease ANKZF1 isoform X2 n=1 Tax=Hemibagrus wyckioides TaxID=337641 RepID=UPI00266C0552|nr:tRNA endonuclease ANKZF1 isoform X2 [Hemibagrus wyckioides]
MFYFRKCASFMMAKPNRCSLFDLVVDLKLTDGLREISEFQNHPETLCLTLREEFPEDKRGTDVRRGEAVSLTDVSDRKFCSACQCSFESREEQMEHYKLDWHRFNLRQRLAGRSPITVEEFEKKTGMGDMSSISGSDSENEESHSEEEEGGGDGVISSGGRLSPRVLLQNSQGQYFCLYRCAVQKKTRDSEANLVDSLLNISDKTVWVILMTGGGHFAGAVYKGKEVVQHKTFHRYTVRAKRGTGQSARDAQNRAHAPKSAGASLRRYNEAALIKCIQELLKSWAEYLTQADAIFLRTPKYNRSVFFGGRGAPLMKKDSRIQSIPFATRRATFSEITRVHDVLSTMQTYDKITDISSILSSSKRLWQKKASNPANQNAAAHHVVQQQDDQEEEEEEEEVSVELQMEDVSLTTLDLREHEVKPGKKKRRKRKEGKLETKEKEGKPRERENLKDETGNEKVEDETGNEKVEDEKTKGKKNLKNSKHDEDEVCVSWEFSIRDALYTACKTGDTEALHALLKQDTCTLIRLLNTPIDSAGYTLLHVASAAAQKHAVKLLLEMGSDPTCRDRKGQTPYVVAPDKECRNMFRMFMAEHPDKYDYAKAQVPGPLTAEIESKKAEKKKAQKAAKKQREKEQREEKRREEEEQEEKRRFLALSDREKRALAAERRLAEQVATTGGTLTNIRRCWQCGESLLGKVPFEYLNFCFCSTRCVQTHRKKTTVLQKP